MDPATAAAKLAQLRMAGLTLIVFHGDGLVRPDVLFGALLSLGITAIWSLRFIQISAQRRVMALLNQLSEEVAGAKGPSQIFAKLRPVLPKALDFTGVRLYLVDKASQSLQRIPTAEEPGIEALPLNMAGQSVPGPLLCYRNRVLMAIGDARKSSIRVGNHTGGQPRSVLYVPMLVNNEPLGVLELYHAHRVRRLHKDEQTAVQHLANQFAASLKLQEQQALHEQFLRSGKLVAAEHLIAGVAGELRGPLDAIARAAEKLTGLVSNPEAEEAMRSVTAEAERANQILARLLSFVQSSAEAVPLELNALVEAIVQGVRKEWAAEGVQVALNLNRDPIRVLGVEIQLKEAIQNLLTEAANSLRQSSGGTITVTSRTFGGHSVIEISFPSLQEDKDTPGEGRVLELCRAVFRGHHGDLRVVCTSSDTRYTVELPVSKPAEAPREQAPSSSRASATVLLVEPDQHVQRGLLMLLSRWGHRVVPVPTAEEALDLAQNFRFDLVFSSSHLPGLNWLDFFERVRRLAGPFVLLSDGIEPGLAARLQSGQGHVLRKPVSERELETLLAALVPANPATIASTG